MEKIVAQDLRIGNWISNGEKMFTVDISSLYDIGAGITDKFMEGIPLSPSILEKCGFEKEYKIKLYRGRFLEWSCGKEFWICDNKDELYQVENIQYLHQLQNLYYCLTGQELPVTL